MDSISHKMFRKWQQILKFLKIEVRSAANKMAKFGFLPNLNNWRGIHFVVIIKVQVGTISVDWINFII